MKFDLRRRLSQYRLVTLQSLLALLFAFLAFHNAIASLGKMRCFGQMRLGGTEDYLCISSFVTVLEHKMELQKGLPVEIAFSIDL